MRAKFQVQGIQETTGTYTDPADSTKIEEKPIFNLLMIPVYANSDGSKNDENSKYWNATPAGSIQLSVVNKVAVEALNLKEGDMVYVDFTKA